MDNTLLAAPPARACIGKCPANADLHLQGIVLLVK